MPGFKRLFRRSDGDILRDIDDELQCHLAMKARDLEERHLTEADARDEALSRFGNLAEIRNQCLVLQSSVSRRRSRRNVLDSSLQDLRVALRGLRRSPGFTAVAVFTLALGIGGTTAIFSVLNSVLLRPLPYPAPERLVQMFERNPERAAERGWSSADVRVSAHNYRDYRELNTVFEDMGWAGWAGNASGVNLTGGDRPQRIVAVSTSASLFSTLGVEPLLGRTWLPSEDGFAFEGPRVAILSHGLWVREFGADPAVLGRTITVDEWPHTVVGIMPPHFDIPPLESGGALSTRLSGADLYVPLSYNAFGLSRGARQFHVIARLREGVEVERAEEEMNALSQGISETNSDVNEGWSVRLIPLEDLLTRSLGPQIALVMAAVGLVLLIGCANVANLLLARGAARSPEIAIRAALGGGRSRIVRQLLTESLVLATVAGGIGLLLAYSGTRVLVSLIPAGIPRADAANIDGTVLVFAMLLSLGTGVAFGIVPALKASRADLATAMRGGERRGMGSRTRGGMSHLLVTGEVALALVLLVGAGLLTRNFARLAGADLGFEPENLIKVSVDLGRPNAYNSKYYTCDLASSRPLLWNRCPPRS